MIIRFLLFNLGALFCIVCFNVSANDVNTVSDKLQVVTEHWYPYNFLDENNKIVGSATKSVKRVLDATDLSYVISLNSWERSYNLARTKKNVVIYSILRTPAREHLFHWVCPIANQVQHSVYKLASRKDIKLESEDDILNYSVNITRGTFSHEYFLSKGMVEGKNLQLTSTNNANILMLLKNRVDLIIEADFAIENIINFHGYPLSHLEKIHSFTSEQQGETCMAISLKTSDVIVDKIKDAHSRLSQ